MEVAVKISYSSYFASFSCPIAPTTSTCETETSKNKQTHNHTKKKRVKDREKLHTSLTHTKCLSHSPFFLLLDADDTHIFWSSLVLHTHTQTHKQTRTKSAFLFPVPEYFLPRLPPPSISQKCREFSRSIHALCTTLSQPLLPVMQLCGSGGQRHASCMTQSILTAA